MRQSARTTLSRMDLLDGLGVHDLDELALAVRPFRMAPGGLLCRQGEAPGDAFFVSRGRVEISVRLPGEEVVLLRGIGPGEVVGETGASRRRASQRHRSRDR